MTAPCHARRLALLLAGWLPALALAQVPQPGPAALPSVSLGRLFNTPGERGAMETQRGGAAAPAGQANNNGAAPAAPGSEAVPMALPPPVTLDGVVRPSRGQPTVWLNQQPQQVQRNQLLRNGAVGLRSSVGRPVQLKPGQSFDTSNGTVNDIPRE